MSFYGKSIRPGSGEPLRIVERGWDPRSGSTVTYEWDGRKEDIELLELEQRSLGRRTSFRTDDRIKYVLQATAGAEENTDKDTPFAIEWGIEPAMIEKSLWEHAKIIDILSPILEEEDFAAEGRTVHKRVAYLRRDFDAFIRGDDTTTYEGQEVDLSHSVLGLRLADINIGGGDPRAETFISFLRARLKGAEAFPEFTYELTKTVTIAKGSTIKPNKENVGRMFTVGTLKSSEGLDDETIIGEMPEGFWLKLPASTKRTGPDKYDISQKYIHAGTFEKFIYDDEV